MSDQNQKPFNDANMRRRAFSRWENEGGAPASGREKHHEKGYNTTPKRITDLIENKNPGLANN